MTDDYHGPRRWPWVLLALAVALLLVIVGGHWIWSAGSARRLKAQIAIYKAAGEPIELEDFAIVGVSDAENAAIDLRKAARSIDKTTKASDEFDRLEPALPLTPKEIAAI